MRSYLFIYNFFSQSAHDNFETFWLFFFLRFYNSPRDFESNLWVLTAAKLFLETCDAIQILLYFEIKDDFVLKIEAYGKINLISQTTVHVKCI